MTRNKRFTIEDVAEQAGVSRATVDRVVNGRGGVRADTVEKVNRVLSSLRYSASSLDEIARPPAKRIEAILSQGTNPWFTEIQDAIRRECHFRDTAAVTRHDFDPYAPDTLVELLASVGPGTDAVITVGVDSPAVADQIARLYAQGTRVVTLISDVSLSDKNCHVGQNDFLAGKTAARLMLNMVGERRGPIAILIGHLQFRHLLDRRAGFEQSIQLSDRGLTILHVPPYGSDTDRFDEVFEASVRNVPDLAGIYLCGGGQPAVFDAVRSFSRKIPFIAHEITDITRAGLANGSVDAIVAYDMADLARKAVDEALAPDPSPVTRCRINIHVHENLR